MKNYWFFAAVLMLTLALPGCRYVVDGQEEEGRLSFYCSPSSSGPTYYDGEYHWEFSVYLKETGREVGVRLVNLTYNIYHDGAWIGGDGGNCGFISDFFGEGCYLHPGESWRVDKEISYPYRTDLEVEFLIVGFDDWGLEIRDYASFRAYD